MRKKQKIMIGIDEVGRGCLSGPVVAAAVFISPMSDVQRQTLIIKDSKKMTAKQREEVFESLKKYKGVEWGIGRVGERVIDKINIFEASKLAMVRAVQNLEKKLQKQEKLRSAILHGRTDLPNEIVLLIDGNFTINLPGSYKQRAIIKGDEKVPVISMASIIAKVSRDRMMQNYHKKYPSYYFDRHKGYPTKLHCKMLKKHGICKIHRKTFAPVAWLLQK